jgi:hypothetical protein
MHLVSSSNVTTVAPRWARASSAPYAAEESRVITVGLGRTTVLVLERAETGEARARHVGMVRLLAGDGQVIARRRIVSTESAGETAVAPLLDEVRASRAAAPHLVVALIQDAGDATWAALADGLAALERDAVIDGWCEAIDRGALRSRLARTLCVIDAPALAREQLTAWNALDAWDDAIDGAAAFLLRNRALASRPSVVDAQLRFLTEHQFRVRYAAHAGR